MHLAGYPILANQLVLLFHCSQFDEAGKLTDSAGRASFEPLLEGGALLVVEEIGRHIDSLERGEEVIPCRRFARKDDIADFWDFCGSGFCGRIINAVWVVEWRRSPHQVHMLITLAARAGRKVELAVA
jgi:hypothetical protein